MANITGHWWLILALLIIVLIIWGPGKLPDVGAGMGRAIREFRKASSETKETIVNATSSPASSNSSAQASTEATPVAAAPAGSAQHEEQKS
ncbi:MAG TPA: twin-arginine translocase TatA/TatE family subunit [Candidatus Dormibacteraeota bacterium]|nr:twin-arginine translocase TatA/TatE family subunit [Candidatus Dormibacteraeota bacterium]